MMIKRILVFGFFLVNVTAFSQFIPEHLSNKAIYDFLDELASQDIIALNTTVKPYSKAIIGQKLMEASIKKGALSKRQRQELKFYLKAFRPDQLAVDTTIWPESRNYLKKSHNFKASLNPFEIKYKDSLFTIVARPIYGIEYRVNENGNVNHTYGGFEAFTTIGHWGIYANLRDNHETELMARPTYFTLNTGGAFKENNGNRKGGDYSEMRGGITYAWKWGDVGLLKDHFMWGDNYHGSNIFSGRTPSFAHIRLHLHPAKWIDFNYVHGWLVSEVVDSTRSYYNNGLYKRAFKQKFLAANMLTITPFKKFSFSFGNSIIYSDLGGIHPAYLIPMAFYKSIDHTLNHSIDNQNSQLFFNLSSRQIRYLHLYGAMFVDEFSITRLKSKEAHNFISWKGGVNLSNFPLKDLSLTAEFTQTTPITYKHDVPAVTFESNQYNLGHYLRDNSREVYLAIRYRPFPRFLSEFSYTMAEHGNEYAYIRQPDIANKPMLTDITWKSEIIEFKICYQLVNNTFIYAEYAQSNIQGGNVDGKTAQYYLDIYTAPLYQGKTNTISLGFNLGF